MSFVKISALAVFSIFILSVGIEKLDIYGLDEVKNARAAQEMMEKKDCIVPTFNGKLRVDKPPLHYYAINLSYQIWGVSPFSARFFSVIAGVLTVLTIFLLIFSQLGGRHALYASFLLLTSLHFNIQMRMSVPDPYLIFLLTFSGACFYWFFEDKRPWAWWGFYISIGLGILSKGPIAIVLPVLAVVSYLLFSKRLTWGNIWRIQPFLGFIISLGIAFPWFWLVHKKTNGIFTEGFFFKHNIQRFSSEFEGHGGWFVVTLMFVILGLLPWVFFFFRLKSLKTIIRTNRIYLFSACFSGSTILFFMLSGTKLPNYTMPALPWLYIILSGLLLQIKNEKLKPYLTAILVFSFLLAIVTIIGLRLDRTVRHLYYLGIPLFIISIGAWVALYFRNSKLNWLKTLIVSWLIMGFVFFNYLYPRIYQENPVAKTQSMFSSSDAVAAYGKFNPAYIFALNRNIPIFNKVSEIQEFISKHPEGGKIILRSGNRREDELKMLSLKVIAREPDIFEKSTTLILQF